MSEQEIIGQYNRLDTFHLDHERFATVKPEVLDLVDQMLPPKFRAELGSETVRELAEEMVDVIEGDVEEGMINLQTGEYRPGILEPDDLSLGIEEYLKPTQVLAAYSITDRDQQRLFRDLIKGKAAEEVRAERAHQARGEERQKRAAALQIENIKPAGEVAVSETTVIITTQREKFTIPKEEYERALETVRRQAEQKYCAFCHREAQRKVTAHEAFDPPVYDGYQFCFDCSEARYRAGAKDEELGPALAAMEIRIAKKKQPKPISRFRTPREWEMIQSREKQIEALRQDAQVEEYLGQDKVSVEVREPIPGSNAWRGHQIWFEFPILAVRSRLNTPFTGFQEIQWETGVVEQRPRSSWYIEASKTASKFGFEYQEDDDLIVALQKKRQGKGWFCTFKEHRHYEAEKGIFFEVDQNHLGNAVSRRPVEAKQIPSSSLKEYFANLGWYYHYHPSVILELREKGLTEKAFKSLYLDNIDLATIPPWQEERARGIITKGLLKLKKQPIYAQDLVWAENTQGEEVQVAAQEAVEKGYRFIRRIEKQEIDRAEPIDCGYSPKAQEPEQWSGRAVLRGQVRFEIENGQMYKIELDQERKEISRERIPTDQIPLEVQETYFNEYWRGYEQEQIEVLKAAGIDKRTFELLHLEGYDVSYDDYYPGLVEEGIHKLKSEPIYAHDQVVAENIERKKVTMTAKEAVENGFPVLRKTSSH